MAKAIIEMPPGDDHPQPRAMMHPAGVYVEGVDQCQQLQRINAVGSVRASQSIPPFTALYWIGKF